MVSDSAVGNIISREAVCYNVGYIKLSKGFHLHFEVRSKNTKTGNKIDPNTIQEMNINKNPNKYDQF